MRYHPSRRIDSGRAKVRLKALEDLPENRIGCAAPRPVAEGIRHPGALNLPEHMTSGVVNQVAARTRSKRQGGTGIRGCGTQMTGNYI